MCSRATNNNIIILSIKKSYSFLILILFGCFNQVLVSGQTFQPVERTIGKLHISIDPRMEILTTVQLLANNIRIQRNTPYSKDILNYFESFSSHEAVVMSDSLLQKYMFSDDAPVTFMLYLSQLPELERQIPFSNYLKGRSGGGDNLEQYREAIKQFAEISNFETFWNSKISFYNQILDLTIAELNERDVIKVLEDYYLETKEGYNIIIMPSFSGGIGPRITDADGKEMIYSCIATTNEKDGIPYLDESSLLFLVWHEFGHSFVNPVVDKYYDKIASAELYEPIKSYMLRQGYASWEICVYELAVRAIHIRLYDLHLGAQQSKALLESELKQRFIYIEPLVEKLKDYEIQRDKNEVTFSDFYPELLNVLDSLQRIEYWKQFNLNFDGPIYGPIFDEKVAIIYPTHDLDTEALKIAQTAASQFFDFITQYKGGFVLLADTTALKTDLSEHSIMAYGTIESNLFLKHYAATFPFRVENQTIYTDKEHTNKDLKFISCVLNPLNPKKGMSIFTAFSNRALQGINDVLIIDGDFPFLSVDYVLYLNRETVISKGFYKKDAKWEF